MRPLALALTAAVSAVAVSVQTAAQVWRIPARGVVEFERTVERFELTPAGGAASREAAEKLFDPIWPRALLFDGELDATKRRIELPPWDLRALPRFLALDLSTADFRGKQRLTLPRLAQFGDIAVELTVEPAADGRQTILCELSSRPPERRADEDSRYLKLWVEPHLTRTVQGTLRIERTIDAELGVVAEARAELDVAVGGNGGGQLALGERWKAARVRENRDAEFEEAVRTAIDRGAGWIRNELSRKRGHVGPKAVDHAAVSANSGRLALALLTLLKAGVRQDDPVVRDGFEELRTREILDTYSAGLALLAVEALYTPPTERQELLDGRITKPWPRQPSEEDRAVIARLAERVCGNLDTRVDPADVVRFNYTPAARYDNSVTQYGLLGLYAAQLCGVGQSARFWRAAADHWIQELSKPRGSAVLSLVSNREFRSSRQYDENKRSVAAGRVDACGWGYQAATRGRPTFEYGSMTVAGLAGLAICQSALRSLDVKPPPAADDAVRAGFAWLANHLRWDTNPNQFRTGQRWLYYHLYGLERACELHGVALICDRDWYFEGASTLIDLQLEDGTWPAEGERATGYGYALERTCFAVLFLRKDAPPVVTPR